MGIKTRLNANAYTTTSDKFISEMPDYMKPDYVKPEGMTDKELEDLRATYADFMKKGSEQPYKESPLDADDHINITPYLKQYVSVQFDDTATTPIEFTEEDDFQRVDFPAGVQHSIRTVPNLPE